MSALKRIPGWAWLVAVMVAALTLVAVGVAVDKPTESARSSASPCSQPGKKVGHVCSATAHEHGVTVVRRYTTMSYADGSLYAFEQMPVIYLNRGDVPTINNLCRVVAVASLDAEHSDYQTELSNAKIDTCDPAQKAKDAGASDLCYRQLRNVSANTRNQPAFSYANLQKACASSPKQKPASYRLTS